VGLRDGNLVLTVNRVGASGGTEFVGGGVMSKEPLGYGYYEARLRVLAGKGWLTTFGLRSGGDGQEFAVVEHDSADAKKYRVRSGKANTAEVRTLPLTDYHVYGCEYNVEAVKYYLDGKLVGTAPAGTGEVSILIDAAAAAGGGKDSVDTGRLPGHIEIDYVRYYRRQD
jgi:beta-glucanase (GH16 family)